MELTAKERQSISLQETQLPIPLNDHLPEPVSPVSLNYTQVLTGLCVFAFLLNCLPSEAFLTKYLKHDKHLTDDQLNNYVWPADTYATFIFMLPIGLLAEVCGYRLVIAVGLIFRQLTRLILIFGNGLVAMVAMQVSYAGSSCVNTVFFAYVYMAVPESRYQHATAIVHACFHLGNVVASGLGQILVSYSSVGDNLVVLFYLSWAFITLAVIVFFTLLPAPIHLPPPSLVGLLRTHGVRSTCGQLVHLYRHPTVVLLSIWWLFAVCVYSIVVNYYQVQFSDIDPNGQYGTVEVVIEAGDALAALIAAIAAVARATQASPFAVFSSTSLAVGVAMLASTWLQQSVIYSYTLNIVWMSVYSFQIAVASALIALCANSPRYAVLFTLNTFLALGLASIGQAVGTQLQLNTSGYFYMGAAGQGGLLVCMLGYYLVYVRIGKHSKGGCCARRMPSLASVGVLAPLIDRSQAVADDNSTVE